MSGELKPVPYVPASAPFTAEQRAWLNGYLAGLFCLSPSDSLQSAPVGASETKISLPLLILYGSQTGTAEALAKRAGAEAAKHGHKVRIMEMSRFTEIQLPSETHLLIVTSTWGDGDPPDNAASFWSFLNCSQAPSLLNLNFAVLALGDRNYSNFCGAGRKFDERLEQLGARRICARVECDVDYEGPASTWLQGLWPLLEDGKTDAGTTTTPTANETEPATEVPIRTGYSRSN